MVILAITVTTASNLHVLLILPIVMMINRITIFIVHIHLNVVIVTF